MQMTAHNAAQWLTSKVKNNTLLNPIPFALFKSTIERQVNWARTTRGLTLNFDELAEAVRAELLAAGITIMQESKKKAEPVRETGSLFVDEEQRFVCRTCGMGNVDKKNCPLYNVVVHSNRAGDACIFMCAFYHDAPKCQTPAQNSKEEFHNE